MKKKIYSYIAVVVSVIYALLFSFTFIWAVFIGGDYLFRVEFILCFVFPFVNIILYFKQIKQKQLFNWYAIISFLLPLITYDMLSVTQVIEEPGGKNTFDKKLFIFDEKVFDKMPLFIELKDTIIKNQEAISKEIVKNKSEHRIGEVIEDSSHCYYISFDNDYKNKLPFFDSLTSKIIKQIGTEYLLHLAFCRDKSLVIFIKSQYDNSKKRYFIDYETFHYLKYYYKEEKDDYFESTKVGSKDTLICKEWVYEVYITRGETFYH